MSDAGEAIEPPGQQRDWPRELGATGSEREEAVRDLHLLLRRVSRREAARRRGTHGLAGRELDDLAEQAANDAVVSVLRRLGDFRGESRFTTWACKFVVREVSDKIGRHAWRTHRVPLGETCWDRLPQRLGAGPAEVAESRDLLRAVTAAVEAVLTPHQRRVFGAMVIDGVPLDALTVELDTNRNAIYKTMFDARRKLRAHLEQQGYLSSDTTGESR